MIYNMRILACIVNPKPRNPIPTRATQAPRHRPADANTRTRFIPPLATVD